MDNTQDALVRVLRQHADMLRELAYANNQHLAALSDIRGALVEGHSGSERSRQREQVLTWHQNTTNGADGMQQSIDSLVAQVAELRSLLHNTIYNNTRSMPGLGNLTLSESRVLTRLSMPEYFPYREPLYIVNSDDRLILPRLAIDGHYELATSRFVSRFVRPGWHAIDVGANFGYYSIILGLKVGWKGKVLCFEPEPLMHQLLSENVLANWVDQWVRIVRAACSDTNGKTTLYSASERLANTGAHVPSDNSDDSQPKFKAFDVTSVRLDDCTDFLDDAVDFLKIDVEGSEPLVILGATKTFERNPNLVVLMEWSPQQLIASGHNIGDFAQQLSSIGKTCYRILEDGRLSTMTFLELVSSNAYQNIVLAPAPNNPLIVDFIA